MSKPGGIAKALFCFSSTCFYIFTQPTVKESAFFYDGLILGFEAVCHTSDCSGYAAVECKVQSFDNGAGEGMSDGSGGKRCPGSGCGRQDSGLEGRREVSEMIYGQGAPIPPGLRRTSAFF